MRAFIAAAFILFAFTSTALAATQSLGTGVNGTQSLGTGTVNPSSGQNITLVNPLKGVDCTRANGDCLMAFLNDILQYVIRIGAIAVILMLVYVGFLFVVARGNSEKLVEARKALLWTVVGALILLGAEAISYSIQATVQAISVGG